MAGRGGGQGQERLDVDLIVSVPEFSFYFAYT